MHIHMHMHIHTYIYIYRSKGEGEGDPPFRQNQQTNNQEQGREPPQLENALPHFTPVVLAASVPYCEQARCCRQPPTGGGCQWESSVGRGHRHRCRRTQGAHRRPPQCRHCQVKHRRFDGCNRLLLAHPSLIFHNR